MKKQAPLLFILFISFSISSIGQSISIAGLDILIKSKSRFKPAIIYFADGTDQKGEIKNLVEKSQFHLKDPFSEFKKVEKQFNMTDETFEFKTFDQEVTTINAHEVKRVVLYPDNSNNTVIYDLKKIKTIKPKTTEIIETNLTAWIPLTFEGEHMNMYVVYLIEKQGLKWTQVYLGKPQDDFVISGIDYNKLNLFNAWSFDEIFEKSQKAIFQDCPLIIEDIEKNSSLKLSRKEAKESRKAIRKGRKQLLDSIKKLDKKERKAVKDVLLYEYDSRPFVEPYEKYIKMYNNGCQE